MIFWFFCWRSRCLFHPLVYRCWPTRYLNTPSDCQMPFSKLHKRQHVSECVFFVHVCVCTHAGVLSQLQTDSDDKKIDRKKNDEIIECHRAKTIMFMINEFFSLHLSVWIRSIGICTNEMPNGFANKSDFIIYFRDVFSLLLLKSKTKEKNIHQVFPEYTMKRRQTI